MEAKCIRLSTTVSSMAIAHGSLQLRSSQIACCKLAESPKHGISIRRRPLVEMEKPRNVLEEIIWYKGNEVADMKSLTPLEKMRFKYDGPPRDFVAALRTRAAETGVPALIAEIKKASPSRGVIQPDFDPVRIAKAYEQGGAACLSVLTDAKFFQGGFENLNAIRASGVQCPLLCKEFIIDPWQLHFARANGADAALLIAAVLSDEEIVSLMEVASSLGLASLIEVHDEEEMDRVLALPGVQLIGINNRNLATFEVDITNTVKLLDQTRMEKIQEAKIIVVGESGLFTPSDVALVQNAGVGAVLVGESLVKQDEPGVGIAKLFGKNISRVIE